MKDITVEWPSSVLDLNKKRKASVQDGSVRGAEWSEKVKEETGEADSWTEHMPWFLRAF